MTLEELLSAAPVVLGELTAELFRRGHESMLADDRSQETACFLAAIRAISLLNGMAAVLLPDTLDSFETLCRAHVEARDLLMTFRFDDRGAREKIGYWFAGRDDHAWKADHTKCDEFLTRLGAQGLQLATNWSKLTALSHPTKYAVDNSASVIAAWVNGRPQNDLLSHKKADFIACVSRLIMAVIYDLPGWIPLGCNEQRMPNVESFRANAEQVAPPILNEPLSHGLPEGSYRPPKRKN
jgi:hypothetical protein